MVKRYKKYRETSIESIGEIPLSWKLLKLKHLLSVKSGDAIGSSELSDDYHIPVYGGNGIMGYTNRFGNEDDKIIIGRVGAYCGNVHLATGQKWVSDNALIVETKQNKEYLTYLLRSINLNSLANKNAQPLITGSMVKDQIVPVPPTFEEQTQIAHYLDYQTDIIDQLICKKQKLIELLKEKRQSIINEAVTTGLNPNAKMKDSGIEWLGKIPVDWKLTPFRFIAVKIGSGVTPKGGAEVYTEEGVIFIRSQNVHFDGLRLDDVAKIDLETHQKMSNSRVQFKDVLLNITGASIGRCCVVNNGEEMNVNQHVCIIRPKFSKVVSEYLNLVLQSDIGQTQVRMELTSGNRDGLTFESIKAFVLPLPDLNFQNEIVNQASIHISQLFDLEAKIISQIEKLKEFRQSLISEAVTGKIDVREWQPNANNN